MLHAEAHAPFANSAWLALRAPDGAEIWYWDRDRLPSDIATASPESVWRAPAEGWRIVACIDGFEAQCIVDGRLIASTWRRERFDESHWASFVASVDASAPPAPAAPPQAQSVSLGDSQWRRRRIKAPLGWKDAEHAGISVAACSIAVTLFFAGQTLRHDARGDAAERAAAATEALFLADPDLRRARERQGLATAAADAIGGLLVLRAMPDVLSVFDQFAIEPRALTLEGTEFRAVIDQPEYPVREIIARLEETGWLCGVTPEIISRGGGVELRGAAKSSRDAPCAPADSPP